jgi:acyl dehydratase
VSRPTLEQVKHRLSSEPVVSHWFEVTQAAMNRFADATDDQDWMHTDPDRARREGFDGTIAFGFWTLSMLTRFFRDAVGGEYPPGVRYGFNYGLDRVRFLAPIPVGGRIRNHLRVTDVRQKREAQFVIATHNEIELEGREEPAMVADWLVLLVYP